MCRMGLYRRVFVARCCIVTYWAGASVHCCTTQIRPFLLGQARYRRLFMCDGRLIPALERFYTCSKHSSSCPTSSGEFEILISTQWAARRIITALHPSWEAVYCVGALSVLDRTMSAVARSRKNHPAELLNTMYFQVWTSNDRSKQILRNILSLSRRQETVLLYRKRSSTENKICWLCFIGLISSSMNIK